MGTGAVLGTLCLLRTPVARTVRGLSLCYPRTAWVPHGSERVPSTNLGKRNPTMTSPTKPKKDNLYRVYRGGGAWYSDDAARVRAASRFRDAPAVKYDFLGFRLIQSGCRQQVLGGVTPP